MPNYCFSLNKHLAYGRQRNSQPMQIVTPIFLFPLASKKGLIAIFVAPPPLWAMTPCK